MARLLRRLSVFAAVVAAAARVAPGGRGQQKAIPIPPRPGTPAEEKFTDAVTLPRNPESKRLIQAAQDYIKTKDWRIAGECLQALLETPEDSFIEVKRTNEAGQESEVKVSVRTEANRLIGALPPEG